MLIKSNSEEQTFNIGKNIGMLLEKGDLVCLDGDLGVGKTVLVRGIAAGLGIDDYITSPTYTLVNEYIANINLYHFDVYRIDNEDDLYEIGFWDYVTNGVCIIEWAKNVENILPSECVKIHIDKVDSYSVQDDNYSNDKRLIDIEFTGEKYKKIIDKLKESGK